MNDTLRELRSIQAGIEQDTREYFMAMRWFLGGILLGAGGMFCVMFSVYEQPKAKPMVTVEQVRPGGCVKFTTQINEVLLPSPQVDKIVMPKSLDGGTIDAKITYRQTATSPNVGSPVPLTKADIEVKFARIDQRLDELTFAARKLAGVKQTWDLKRDPKLAEAVANRDSIREMVAKLGEVGK